MAWRAWALDCGPEYTSEAPTRREAIAAVVEDYRGPDEPLETYWISVAAVSDDGDEWQGRVPVHPVEPECTSEEHDWSLLAEHLHDGGVVITHRCPRCGLERTKDTWAQDRGSGRQGLVSIRYERPSA